MTAEIDNGVDESPGALIFVLLAGLVGAVSVLAWAPFGYWVIALVAYALLFLALNRLRTAWQAAAVGYVFGLGLHLTGSGWIEQALQNQTGLSQTPAILSTFVFVSYLALFTSLPCGLWKLGVSPVPTRPGNPRDASSRTGTHGTAWAGNAFLFAALLTLGEWSRSRLFNGFTSLSLGYALIDSPLHGYAPVFGVYGLSFVGYLSSASIGSVIFSKPQRSLRLMAALAAVLILFVAGSMLWQVQWVEPVGKPLSYRLLQINIDQSHKFDPAYIPQEIDVYERVIMHHAADLIVTPETAFPLFLHELPADALHRLQTFSSATGSHVFLGIATIASNSSGYNSVIDLAPDSDEIHRYDKVDLMPFGEYTPWGFRWFTNRLSIPLKDLSAGSELQRPFPVNGQRVGVLICQEDLIGRAARRWLPDATVFINPSNLGWFDRTLAISQRIQIVRMRALEVGRPILRAANTGVTASIDAHGNLLRAIPVDTKAVLAGRVQPMRGWTPYSRWGQGPLMALTLLLGATLWLARKGGILWSRNRSRPE